jgi:hypothetical protein
MASSIDNTAWLEWMTKLMGGVSRQMYAATLPPHRFYCLLDELPAHLIPHSALRSWHGEKDSQQRLSLNPQCILCSGDEIPGEFSNQRELVSGFALQGTVAWVRNPAGSTLLPFWLGPRLEAVLRNLRPNEPAPSTLSKDLTRLLTAARILVPETQDSSGDQEKDKSSIRSSLPFEQNSFEQNSFREKGYTPLRNLIHPFHIAALRRYYRYLIRTGAITLGDRQSSRRYAAHNEPVARFFHHHIAPTLSAIAGEPVRPSYVYLASYLSRAELKKHVDREQCEFSVTFCLDFSPEPALETPWPIRLETPTGTVTVYQALGDGLAYRGTRLPHYRDRLGEGQTSTSIFFHYVPADFEGSLG